MKRNRGLAFISVIIMFVVSFILLASMTLLFRQDLNETTNQDHRTEAYYLALSGIEIGYAALMTDIDPDVNVEKLYYEDFTGSKIGNVKEQKGISYGNGKIDIRLSGKKIDGKDWVVINSTGKLNDSDISISTNMEFMSDNPAIIKRYK